jgi:DNA-binding HxlR family transcriptional regulator
MTERSYNQLCGISRALDLVGERWTLLIIRELIVGPRRFKDLMAGMPGISTNLLSERLKGLEQQGLIRRRTLPPPAGVAVYELTQAGQALEPTLLELGRWGSRFIASAPAEAILLPVGSYALTPKTFFRPERAQGIDETYELHIGEEIQHIHIANGQIMVRQGEAPQSDVRLYADVPTYLGLLGGRLTPQQAVTAGAARIEGDLAALERYLHICGIPSE